jgi:hypothetical protein
MEANWTPVKEALPDFELPVWTWDGVNIQVLERYSDADGWLWANPYNDFYRHEGKWRSDSSEMDAEYTVTHWMPLPEPPDGG